MIAVGVDTHKHRHIAVAVSELGQLLGEIAVAASAAGYRELVTWLDGLDGEAMVGIEGAGSYGAGLCRHLQTVGISAVEVERPRRRDRRQGKSDRLDALLAAKRVLSGEGVSTPRAGGNRSALSVLLVAYRSCVEERTRLLNQLQGLHVTAPAVLRERIGHGNGAHLAGRLVRTEGVELTRALARSAAGATAGTGRRGRRGMAAPGGGTRGLLGGRRRRRRRRPPGRKLEPVPQPAHRQRVRARSADVLQRSGDGQPEYQHDERRHPPRPHPRSTVRSSDPHSSLPRSTTECRGVCGARAGNIKTAKRTAFRHRRRFRSFTGT